MPSSTAATPSHLFESSSYYYSTEFALALTPLFARHHCHGQDERRCCRSACDSVATLAVATRRFRTMNSTVETENLNPNPRRSKSRCFLHLALQAVPCHNTNMPKRFRDCLCKELKCSKPPCWGSRLVVRTHPHSTVAFTRKELMWPEGPQNARVGSPLDGHDFRLASKRVQIPGPLLEKVGHLLLQGLPSQLLLVREPGLIQGSDTETTTKRDQIRTLQG